MFLASMSHRLPNISAQPFPTSNARRNNENEPPIGQLTSSTSPIFVPTESSYEARELFAAGVLMSLNSMESLSSQRADV